NIQLLVLSVPGKSRAHCVNLDTQYFERLMLAIAVGFRLHELDHAALQPATRRADHQPDRGGGFPFAVARVDHQQALCIFAIIFPTPLVTFFFGFGHVDERIRRRAADWDRAVWEAASRRQLLLLLRLLP